MNEFDTESGKSFASFAYDECADISRELETRERCRTILEACTDAVFIAGADGRITFCNDHTAILCGVDARTDLIGGNLLDLATTAGREVLKAALWDLSKRGGSTRIAFSVAGRHGVEIPVELDLASLVHTGGAVVGVVGFARDVSKHLEAERQGQILAEMSSKLSAAATYQEIGTALRWATGQLWNWDSCSLCVRRSGRNWFKPVMLVDTENGTKTDYNPPRTITDYSDLRTVLDGEIMLINRHIATGPPMPAFGTGRRSESLLFVPLPAGATVAGILSLQSYTPCFFNEGDLGLLSIIGDIAGPALQRCRAEQQCRAFSSLGATLSTVTTARQAACSVLDIAWELFGWNAAFLDLYVPQTGMLEPLLRADREEDMQAAATSDIPVPYLATGVLKKTLEEGPQLVLRHNHEDLGLVPFGSGRLSASLMFAPLRTREGIVGILSVQHYQAEAYTSEDLDLLQALADHCAGALYRARTELDRNRLALAVESAAESIVIAGRSWKIRYVNPAFERITGYSLAEVVGKYPRELLEGGVHDSAFYDDMAKTLEEQSRWKGRFVNKTRDGRIFYEDATISQIRGKDGAMLGYVAVKRDVTHEMAMEAELAHSQKMNALGELAGHIAHDFNNMLQIILGFTETSMPLLPDDTELREAFERVLTSARKGANLTRQLLAFGRRQSLEPRAVNLNGVIRELKPMLHTASGRAVQHVYRLTHDDTHVFVDRDQLEMLLVNLVINARDAMPEGGIVTITTQRITDDDSFPGAGIELRIGDTGTGIPPEIQSHIYDPFFTTKDKDKGSGLGLSSVYGFVKQSGGKITFTTAENQGTEFSIRLPACVQSDAAHAV